MEFGDKKALVIDNSSVMTKIIKNHLLKMGFQAGNIHTANEGNQASLMLELVKFDLMTTGMHLRVKDGPELLRLARESNDKNLKELKVLVISADHQEYSARHLETLKVNGYLSKPFSEKQFQSAIAGIFDPGTAATAPAPAPASAVAGTAAVPSISFDPELVAAFVQSTVEAMGQYMVTAEPGDPAQTGNLSGDFSSAIALTDGKYGVKLNLIIYFPKDTACKIYEGIFGAVDLEQVCGVVQELGNIIGGNIKPRIAGLSQVIYNLAHANNTVQFDGDNRLNFQLGLPTAKMGDNHTVELEDGHAPKFIIPFKIGGDTVTLITVFQKIPAAA